MIRRIPGDSAPASLLQEPTTYLFPMRSRLLSMLLLVLCTACLAGHHYRTDVDHFMGMVQTGANSLASYRIIGATETHVYLSAWSGLPYVLGGGEHIFSVALAELPPEFVQRVRALQGLRAEHPATELDGAPDGAPGLR